MVQRDQYQEDGKTEVIVELKTKASPSAYRLAKPNGEDLEHSWNIDNLRKFFV